MSPFQGREVTESWLMTGVKPKPRSLAFETLSNLILGVHPNTSNPHLITQLHDLIHWSIDSQKNTVSRLPFFKGPYCQRSKGELGFPLPVAIGTFGFPNSKSQACAPSSQKPSGFSRHPTTTTTTTTTTKTKTKSPKEGSRNQWDFIKPHVSGQINIQWFLNLNWRGPTGSLVAIISPDVWWMNRHQLYGESIQRISSILQMNWYKCNKSGWIWSFTKLHFTSSVARIISPTLKYNSTNGGYWNQLPSHNKLDLTLPEMLRLKGCSPDPKLTARMDFSLDPSSGVSDCQAARWNWKPLCWWFQIGFIFPKNQGENKKCWGFHHLR